MACQGRSQQQLDQKQPLDRVREKVMAIESSFQNAVGWAGAQTTNTIKTSERTSGSPTKPGARRAGDSNRTGKQDFNGWEESR